MERLSPDHRVAWVTYGAGTSIRVRRHTAQDVLRPPSITLTATTILSSVWADAQQCVTWAYPAHLLCAYPSLDGATTPAGRVRPPSCSGACTVVQQPLLSTPAVNLSVMFSVTCCEADAQTWHS